MGEHLDNEGENLENLEDEGEHVMIWVSILTMRVRILRILSVRVNM